LVCQYLLLHQYIPKHELLTLCQINFLEVSRHVLQVNEHRLQVQQQDWISMYYCYLHCLKKQHYWLEVMTLQYHHQSNCPHLSFTSCCFKAAIAAMIEVVALKKRS